MSIYQKLCQTWQFVKGFRRLAACPAGSHASDRYPPLSNATLVIPDSESTPVNSVIPQRSLLDLCVLFPRASCVGMAHCRICRRMPCCQLSDTCITHQPSSRPSCANPVLVQVSAIMSKSLPMKSLTPPPLGLCPRAPPNLPP